MKKLKCIIVDDELSAIESLIILIKSIDELELVGTFSTPLDALAFLRKNDVYLVFLDINLPSLTGLEFAKLIPNKVIFTTGHAEFAVRSYELSNVVDYLTKPIYFDRFARAITKASNHYIIDNEVPYSYVEDYLTFKQQGAIVKIYHNSIYYIQSQTNYSLIHYDGKKIIAPIPIWDLEQLLPSDKFVRVNRSYIANRNKIVREYGDEIYLLGGQKLKIGKAFKK